MKPFLPIGTASFFYIHARSVAYARKASIRNIVIMPITIIVTAVALPSFRISPPDYDANIFLYFCPLIIKIYLKCN